MVLPALSCILMCFLGERVKGNAGNSEEVDRLGIIGAVISFIRRI